MFFKRSEVERWGDGEKEDGYGKSGVGMTRQGDIEAEEARQKFGAVGAR